MASASSNSWPYCMWQLEHEDRIPRRLITLTAPMMGCAQNDGFHNSVKGRRRKGRHMPQVTLKGSCLCGTVQYEVTGDPQRFYHCHCSRCRKSSGTGHASNIMMTSATLVFSHGESRLKQFKLPEAKRFSRQFCTECGSPVVRFVPELNAVVIPAGSLDGSVPIKPQARIYWDSRTDWTCDGDTLPRFPEGPPDLLSTTAEGRKEPSASRQ